MRKNATGLIVLGALGIYLLTRVKAVPEVPTVPIVIEAPPAFEELPKKFLVHWYQINMDREAYSLFQSEASAHRYYLTHDVSNATNIRYIGYVNLPYAEEKYYYDVGGH